MTLVRKEHYVIVWMILLATLLLPISHARTKAAEALSETYSSEVARLRQKVDDLEGTPSSLLRYGDPPIPPRPDHPAALTHTYYRGNCERNEELFNNGNYQTAEFHVSLRDADGRLMSAGDSLPDDGLMVRFEMNRSPGTTPALFTEKVISAVYLSQSIYKNDKQPSEESPDVVHLSTIKADWKWSADYPLPSVDPNGELLGIIYVNKGRVTPERVTAIPHYGIRYSLKVEDGRLSDASEIWMGCIFQTPVIAERQTGKIPFSQWYDHNPLPVITGENTSDPELLGIPEHIEGSSVEAQEADQTTTDSDSGQ